MYTLDITFYKRKSLTAYTVFLDNFLITIKLGRENLFEHRFLEIEIFMWNKLCFVFVIQTCFLRTV